ncbi:replication-relaxation family protein [Nocardia brasiliensis]|uniref:replication-relaxation family protein n=1 Tax=Nocardia brasiliensis TaxID=37326 RepID=UPI001892F9B4|nr:replication-relaxation family protein [Nocardia brasiliensis]MBF6546952.1 replication-relaxation family protein [Nocardia brasiliensis]
MKRLDHLREQLSERDLAILIDLQQFRLLTTPQIRRLHFTTGHQTIGAATRACTRVLTRLRAHGLIASLNRRIGGVRRGSASQTWQLAATGDWVLRQFRGSGHRRRYHEPSTLFIKHTLAVAELGVLLREAHERKAIELVELKVEGQAHRTFVGRNGVKDVLKPDLRAITATADFEHHWLIEADRDKEHEPHLLRKLAAYHRYFNSGRYQAEYGLFPSVLWVVPGQARAEQLAALIESTDPLPHELFEICTFGEFIDFVVLRTAGRESLSLPGILESAAGQQSGGRGTPAELPFD